MILFQTHGNNYTFLFPYKEKNCIGFNPEKLEIEKTDDKKYINKKVSLGANKWYEKCDFPENRYRQKRYTKLLSSKKTAGDFKTFEALNPISFFQKDFFRLLLPPRCDILFLSKKRPERRGPKWSRTDTSFPSNTASTCAAATAPSPFALSCPRRRCTGKTACSPG